MKGKNLPVPNLKKLRLQNNATQADFARLLGCTVKTYRGYEKGAEYPDTKCLIDLSDKYNVSIDWILGRSDCTSVDNEYIHQQLGLSDNAINQLKAFQAHDEMFKFTNKLIGKEYAFLDSYDLRLPFINCLLTSYKLRQFINTIFLYILPDKFQRLVVKFNDLQMAEIPKDKLFLSTEKDLNDNVPFEMDTYSRKTFFKTKLELILNDISEEYKNYLRQQDTKN